MKATISANEFKRIIDNTKKFVSVNCNNLLMNYIYLQINKEEREIKATALDRHRISVEYASVIECDESFSCFIKPIIPKISAKEIKVELEVVSDKVYTTVGDFITGCKQPEGKYFDIDKIIADLEEIEPSTKIAVNPKLLKDAIDSAMDISSGRPICRIEIRNPKNPIIIKTGGRNGTKDNIKMVLPMVLPVACDLN